MRFGKRFSALALALLLMLALVPAAEAKTGTLVKNSGTRHEVCTALSSQAQAYYTGNYTYDAVSALVGSGSDPMSSAMFSRLSTLMRTTMTNSVSYNSLTNYWPKTDANNGSSNPVLFYSDEISGNFNREHVWPKSRGSFKETNAGSDLHHLRPTNADINSTRGNLTMGNVKGVYSTYKTKALNGGTVLWYNTDADVVEVRDNIKGDVARILLYVWCRWQEPNLYENDPNPTIGSGDDANDGLKVIESRETLLQWMQLDPVDTWEMSRNDQCENVQGNRNVFIDYPEYAWLLFGLTPPSDYQTPSGEAMNTSSYTVTAVANNAAWGSVSLSNRTITATPNTGYYAESATVSPAGAATLTQNGNTFTVSNLTADCTVTVNFAAKTACTVSFAANGGTGTMASQQVYAGEDLTLPACGFTAPGGQRFAGWKWSLDNAVYQPNATVTVNADCTFTAQWQALSSDAEYVLVETAPADWSGEYLIVYNAGPYAMDGSLSSLDATSNYKTVTLSDKTITVAADENDFYFTVEPNGSGYAIKAASGKYIGWASNSGNGLTSSDTALPITLSLNGTDANIVGSAGAYLRFNTQSGQTRFRFFKSATYSSQKAVSLYKRVEVTPPAPEEPAFMTQSLLLEGKIGVRFYVRLPEALRNGSTNVHFTISGMDGEACAATEAFTSDLPTNAKGYYGFTFYVGTIQMADTITATLNYTVDGEAQTLVKTYSVKEYFEAFDENYEDNPTPYDEVEGLVDLIKATADLGHYVQAYLDAVHSDWSVANGDHAAMDKVYATDIDAYLDEATTAVASHALNVTGGCSDIKSLNYALLMDSDTTIRVTIVPQSGFTGTITATVDGEAAEVKTLGAKYAVEIENVHAHELSKQYTIAITTGNGTLTMTGSGLSYVKMMLTAYAGNDVAINAAIAIYRYSKFADVVHGN